MSAALVVEVLRGTDVESRHEVDVVAVGDDGQIVWSRGDGRRSVLPRSALKPVQAVPLASIDIGESLSAERLAIACGSHGGEPEHVAVVEAWLAELGCGAGDLECGAHTPAHRPSADALVGAGALPTPLHNACSGKHVGFLALCRHLGIERSGYLAVDHPLQARFITPAIEEFCGVSLVAATPGVDGCGIPVWSMPLDRLATGWAALATTARGRTIYGAMVAEPLMVAGSGRACSRLIAEGEGKVVVKTGAEGVYCAISLESGVAVALKARDGATRASEFAVEWAMAELGVAAPPEPREIRNWVGHLVGSIRVAS